MTIPLDSADLYDGDPERRIERLRSLGRELRDRDDDRGLDTWIGLQLLDFADLLDATQADVRGRTV